MENQNAEENTPGEEEPSKEWNASATMIYPAAAVRREAPSEPSQHIAVEVIGGAMDGSRRQTSGLHLTIGRGAENELPLALDPTVSTRHAIIHGDGKHFWLEDLDSRNGTFVGDKRLEDRILIGPGATFRVGNTEIEFMPI